MSERKFFNSHDVAKDHGDVWITSLGGSDSRDHKTAWWGVVAATGRAFIADPNEKLNQKDARKYHVFVTFDDAAAWCLKAYNITGWKRDKFGGYHPDPSAHDRPCGRPMFKDQGRWTSFSVCDRLSVDGGECKFHRSVDLRASTKQTAEAEKRRTVKESSDAGKQIAADAIAALEDESIKARPSSHVVDYDYAYTGEVIIHAEDILRLTRELAHLREMLGK
jgi:hypothetical protein